LAKLLESESIARIDQAIDASKRPKNGVEVTVFGRVKRKVRRVLWPGGSSV